VVQKYEIQSLRGAFSGKDVERDALDVPIVPPEFVELVDLNPRDVLRVRSSGKK
jgi:hypothetical protein